MSAIGVRVSDEVRDALAAARPVVALESTIIAHGLPRPDNLEVARAVEDIVRQQGAVPATIAVLAGVPWVGLDAEQLETIATTDDIIKASRRDLPLVMAMEHSAATTVAATSFLAAAVGIDVFATGGLGGVHQGDIWDESADLAALATTDIVVVCSGVKSILDVRATLERLETYSIPVVGYRTNAFPGFYLTDSGFGIDWRVESPEQVADVLRSARQLGPRTPAIVVANPVAEAAQLDPALHDRVLAAALADATDLGVRYAHLTPFLLERFHASTGGDSLRVNTELIKANAELAAAIAAAIAG